MHTPQARPIMQLLLIALVASGLYGQTAAEQVVTEFEGHQVTLMRPAQNDDLVDTPATVCFDLTSKPQCFTPKDGFYRGWESDADLVLTDLGHGRSALLLSAYATSGGSGASIHLALLRPGDVEIMNMLPSDLHLKEISGHAFVTEPSVSDAPIFVTADYVWGFGETHPEDHRFLISVYVLGNDWDSYELEDQYMTARKYDGTFGFDKTDILDSERPEILARLKRVKAEREKAEREPQSPR
jgi:hypothetical protein